MNGAESAPNNHNPPLIDESYFSSRREEVILLAGRPRCQNGCCTRSSKLIALYEGGQSTLKLAAFYKVSSVHIGKRLKELGVKMKTRGNYPASRGGKRVIRHPLAKMDAETLFYTPVDVLMEKYLCSRECVYRHRKVRKRRIRDEQRMSNLSSQHKDSRVQQET